MSNPWIDANPHLVRDAITDNVPTFVQHRLEHHPLLTLDAIADLAEWLPAHCAERNKAVMPLVHPGGGSPRGNVDRPWEVVRSIGENDSWLVLWNIEQHPAYGQLLADCLDDVESWLPNTEGGRIVKREAFLFVSSPRSLTSLHFDPEHNFLLQISGTKQVYSETFDDPSVGAKELERYYCGGHRNLNVAAGHATEFAIGPGEGVLIPTHVPHWVRNGDEPSISLSVTFHTPAIIRAGRIHVVNARLRRLGFRPRPPGSSLTSDIVKAAPVAIREATRRRTGSADRSL